MSHLPYPLKDIGDLTICVPISNYCKHSKIIDSYATSTETYTFSNVIEHNNVVCTKITITPPNLCELLRELKTDLLLCTFGSMNFCFPYDFCPHHLIHDIIRYKISHKLELLQIVINVWNKQINHIYPTNKTYNDMTSMMFKYDNKDLWLIIAQFDFTMSSDYFNVIQKIFDYSHDDRLLEPLIYVTNKLIESKCINDIDDHNDEYYNKCIERSFCRNNCKMLRLFLDKLHRIFKLNSTTILSGIVRKCYDDTDLILTFYSDHELCLYGVYEYIISGCLINENVLYFISLICEDKIILNDVTINSIFMICVQYDNSDMFKTLLILYPWFADELIDFESYCRIHYPFSRPISLNRYNRYCRYASIWKMANYELRTELYEIDRATRSCCILM